MRQKISKKEVVYALLICFHCHYPLSIYPGQLQYFYILYGRPAWEGGITVLNATGQGGGGENCRFQRTSFVNGP